MLGKILFCIFAAIVYSEATYSGGYSGAYAGGYAGRYGLGGAYDYNGLGLGAGRAAYAYGTPGLPYTVGAVKAAYNYPADVVDPTYSLYYDGGYGANYGANYGALYTAPQKYVYGSNLGYYGNYGYPVKK